MAFENLRKLSLNELISTLHTLITSFSRGLDTLIQKNNQLSIEEIDNLRAHILERLKGTEERADSEKLQKLITLFKDDKRAFELIRKDVDEWIEFLDTIEQHIGKEKEFIGKDEQKTIEALRTDLIHLQDTLRKS